MNEKKLKSFPQNPFKVAKKTRPKSRVTVTILKLSQKTNKTQTMESYNKCIGHQIVEIGKFSDTAQQVYFDHSFPTQKTEQEQNVTSQKLKSKYLISYLEI